MNMHMLFDRFCLSYNLTNAEWWVQDKFDSMGQYKTYAAATQAIKNKLASES